LAWLKRWDLIQFLLLVCFQGEARLKRIVEETSAAEQERTLAQQRTAAAKEEMVEVEERLQELQTKTRQAEVSHASKGSLIKPDWQSWLTAVLRLQLHCMQFLPVEK
jgi:hypothetical protein